MELLETAARDFLLRRPQRTVVARAVWGRLPAVVAGALSQCPFQIFPGVAEPRSLKKCDRLQVRSVGVD